MKKSTITELISALFILLFMYTSISKILNFNIFQITLERSVAIGGLSKLIGSLIIVTEIFISTLLFIPKTRKLGLISSLVLISIFAVYIATMIGFTKILPCSCGGVIASMSWPQHLTFNVALILLSALGIYLHKDNTELRYRTRIV